MSKLVLARKLAYKHLKNLIDERKDEYAKHLEHPECVDYMMVMEVILENGSKRFATGEEYLAALVLDEVMAIEASIECGTATEVYEGETEPLLDILHRRLDAFVAALEQLKRKSFAGKGGDSNSARYEPLRVLAKNLVVANNRFKSRRNAAMTIAPEIIAKGKEIGVELSNHQAVDTITGWLKDAGLPANI